MKPGAPLAEVRRRVASAAPATRDRRRIAAVWGLVLASLVGACDETVSPRGAAVAGTEASPRPRAAGVSRSPAELARALVEGIVRIEDEDAADVAAAMEHVFDDVTDDTDEAVILARHEFLRSLGRVGAPAVAGVVARGGKTHATQLATMATLDAIDPERTRRIAPLVAWLGKKDYLDDVYPPHRGLWEAGTFAIPALAAVLDDPEDHSGGALAAEILERFGTEAAPVLSSLRRATQSSYWLEAGWAARAVFRASGGCELPLGAALRDLSQLDEFRAAAVAAQPGLARDVAVFLNSADPFERSYATRILTRIAPDADGLVAALAELGSGDEFLARDALRDLAALGPRAVPAIPELLCAAASEDAEVREWAYAALAASGDRGRALPALRAAVVKEQGSWPGRRIASELMQFGPEQADVVVPVLATALSSVWHPRRGGMHVGDAEAARELATLGAAAAPAVPVLLRALAPPSTIPAEASRTLAAIGAAALPALVEALDSGGNGCFQVSEAMRRSACWPAADDAVTRAAVRRGAADALGAMGVVAADAVPALRRRLIDGDPAVRAHSALAILRIGVTDGEPPAVLHASLPSADAPARTALLGTLRAADTAALEAVRACESLGDTAARFAVCLAVYRLTGNTASAVAEIRRAFDTGDEDAVLIAGDALRSLGADARAALPSVIGRIDRDPALCPHASPLLVALGPDAAAAVPALLRAADGDRADGVVSVLTAIGPGAAPAVPYLTARLADTRDDDEEIPLLRALGAIGPRAGPALPQIRLRVRDWHADVAAAAEDALARIEVR